MRFIRVGAPVAKQMYLFCSVLEYSILLHAGSDACLVLYRFSKGQWSLSIFPSYGTLG